MVEAAKEIETIPQAIRGLSKQKKEVYAGLKNSLSPLIKRIQDLPTDPQASVMMPGGWAGDLDMPLLMNLKKIKTVI